MSVIETKNEYKHFAIVFSFSFQIRGKMFSVKLISYTYTGITEESINQQKNHRTKRNFEEIVLKDLKKIRYEIKDIKKNVLNIETYISLNTSNNTSDIFKDQINDFNDFIPIHSENSLETLENKLMDDKVKKDLVSCILSILIHHVIKYNGYR